MPSGGKKWGRGLGLQRGEGDSPGSKKCRCLEIRCLLSWRWVTRIILIFGYNLYFRKDPNLDFSG